MGEKLRIAVVGAGGVASGAHLPSLQRIAGQRPGVSLCALCDLVEERARAMADRFGFRRAYVDYRAMLDAEAPDAVWLLTPPSAMREIGGHLLSHGIPVFMEKPPGSNSRETRELAEIAAASHTPNQVAFNRRYAPLMQRIKSLLAEAGGMSAASCQMFRCRRTEPYFSFGTGLHGLDALRFLSNSEAREVRTCLCSGNARIATILFDSGAFATIEILPQVGFQSERYTAHAGERTVVVDGMINWLTLYPGFLHCFDSGHLTVSIESSHDPAISAEVEGGFYGEIAHFIDCLMHGETPEPDLATSIRSVEIAEAVDRGEDVVFHD